MSLRRCGRCAIPRLVRSISGALPEGEYIDLVRQAGFTQINVRRSHSSGSAAGVPVYSIQVSARKAS